MSLDELAEHAFASERRRILRFAGEDAASEVGDVRSHELAEHDLTVVGRRFVLETDEGVVAMTIGVERDALDAARTAKDVAGLFAGRASSIERSRQARTQRLDQRGAGDDTDTRLAIAPDGCVLAVKRDSGRPR
jgi:hypothetical protein